MKEAKETLASDLEHFYTWSRFLSVTVGDRGRHRLVTTVSLHLAPST